VSFLHRFGSALNHHVHLHACATDGVFVPTGGGPPVIRGSKDRIAKVRYVLSRHQAANWVGPGRGSKFTRPGANGVVELSPFEFSDRLADLVPPPRKHRQRYHGVFAPSQPPPQPQHACRPSSALVSIYIGIRAEPVHSPLYLL